MASVFKFKRAQSVPATDAPTTSEAPDAVSDAISQAVGKQNAEMRATLNPVWAIAARPAPQIAPTPKETGVIPKSPNAPETTVSEPSSVVKSAIFDIKRGMPMSDFEATYPELAGKREVFASLKTDLDSGMPEEEIARLYPELSEPEKPEEPFYAPAVWAAEKTAGAFMGGIERIGEAGQKFKEGEYNIGQAGIRGAAGALGALTAPIAGITGQISEWSVEEMKSDEGDWRNKAADMLSIPLQGFNSWYEKQDEDTKQLISDVATTGEVAGYFVGAKTPGAVSKTAPVAIATKAAETAATKAVQAGKSVIGKGIAKTETPAATVPGRNVFGEAVAPVEIEKPGMFARTVAKISDTVSKPDIENLVNRGLWTKFGKMTPGEKTKAVSGAWRAKDMETIHGVIAKGEIDADLNTVLGFSQALQKILSIYWQKIGKHMEDAGVDSSVDTSTAIAKLDKILLDKREAKANPQMAQMAQKYKELLSEHTSLEDIQATKNDIFQDIANLKKENVGRKSFRDFSDAAHEVIDSIERKIKEAKGDDAEFIRDKEIYAAWKRMEKDAADSAVVSQRSSPQSLVEQLADVQIGYDALTDPTSAIARKLGKDIGKVVAERNSRDGAIRQAMEYFNAQLQKRGELAVKLEGGPKVETVKPSTQIGKVEPEFKSSKSASKTLDAIVSDARTAGVDLDKYMSNVSEKSANAMAAHAYRYSIEQAMKGKSAVNLDKLATVVEKLGTGETGPAGKVGDFIKDPYLRKLYADALDTPVEIAEGKGIDGSVGEFVTEGPKKGTILFRTGNAAETTYNIVETLMHEAAHAIRSKKGRKMENDYAPKKGNGIKPPVK